MEIIKKKKQAYLWLLLLGVLTALIWRYEVDYYGWTGLIWLSYFHKAIPIAVLLFVGWFFAFVDMEDQREKLAYGSFLLVVGSLTSYLVMMVLYEVYGMGGAVRWNIVLANTWGEKVWAFLPLVLVAFLPTLLMLLLLLFKIRTPFRYLLLAQAIYWVAPFISIELIQLFSSRGSADVIHIFKTGYIYPFWFFAMGTLLVPAQKVPEENTLEVEVLDAS